METKKGLIIFLSAVMLYGPVNATSMRYPPTQPAPVASNNCGGGHSNAGLIIGTVIITALIAYIGHRIYRRAERRAHLLPIGKV